MGGVLAVGAYRIRPNVSRTPKRIAYAQMYRIRSQECHAIAWLSSSANFWTERLIFSCVRGDGWRLPQTCCDSCALFMPVIRDMPDCNLLNFLRPIDRKCLFLQRSLPFLMINGLRTKNGGNVKK